ncbi:WD40/YVTN/BNR-like repeat-containing protein [Gemmatimonas sp. UBA7669]|uniref:WD40/YVTN/BNR-like repeat-containing protein n=1 Tax=Gemmatimonas sp. UBA7669 TaxID=1946568 RepID=UPI0025B9E14E|nr:sialidase family protein [Gemmatimonas sp. UBA7669]
MSILPQRRALRAALTPVALATGVLTVGALATAPLHAQRGPSAAVSGTAALSAFDSTTFTALRWRNVGPWRGGRSVAVAGLPSNPLTYFAGYTGGGLWRTDDAGISWRNISDGWFASGSIGAIAVAPSDENVLYVGTGEHAIRGQSSTYGNGVYKSTDQGRNWTHVGLAATRQISAVRVHPGNPDVVYVAAQGERWKGTSERGIYRSTDGGKTWTLVLKGENATSGASDLSMDPSNPRILYAAFWDHQRMPWMVRSGGAGSGIWKSSDGGDTWTRLSEGLPRLMGKIGVSVSPANPDRVYAIVEAENGGLFRSDDAGRTWRLQSGDRLIQTRSWYYMKLTADPKNADVVWVNNAPLLRSIDGGRTFAAVPATHGDNHGLWINPADSRYLINANDGGASISLDGGRSWSSQDNQPTAQFYHVSVDDDFPYKLYGGQQDNSSVIIASRSDGGAIGIRDWKEGPGCESANIGVHPAQSRYVYGGCYQGIIDELDQQTGLSRAIMPWPEMNLTEPTDKTKYRFNWTAPIHVSQHDASVVYHGGNVLFRSTTRGQQWMPISPDLTRNDKTRQGWGGGPITNEGAGGEVYGTIVVIEESPHDARTLYVGTDDGLIQRTRDGGATWSNVTPAAWGDGLVNEIAISPHDAATVYVAFRKDRLGDPTPHVFMSKDYGATWTRLVNGLRDGEPVRVVREDPAQRGLLYAGTETGVYVSFDGGARWMPFRGNFPVVPVTDLQVRHGDLIAATEGRAFWILDDLSVLRQRSAAMAATGAHLYAPREAVLFAGSGGFGAPSNAGRNPPYGATVYFRMPAVPDSAATVTLQFLDSKGAVVRSFASRGDSLNRLVVRPGLNTFSWNLRRAAPARVGNVLLFGAPGDGGARVSPGDYSVRLSVGSASQTQPLKVVQDPRLTVPAAVLAERDSVANLLASRIDEIHSAVHRLRDVKTQVQGYVTRAANTTAADTITKAGRALNATLDTIDPKLTTKAANGQDIINYANGINGQYGFLLGQVEGNTTLTQPVKDRLAELEKVWETIRREVERVETVDVPAFNALLKANNVPGVVTPAKPKGPIA